MPRKTVEEMSLVELSRWGALLRSIDIIEENCEHIGKSFNELDLKPIAIKHYINALADNIQKGLELEMEQEQERNNRVLKEVTKNVISCYQNSDALQDNKV